MTDLRQVESTKGAPLGVVFRELSRSAGEKLTSRTCPMAGEPDIFRQTQFISAGRYVSVYLFCLFEPAVQHSYYTVDHQRNQHQVALSAAFGELFCLVVELLSALSLAWLER